MITDYDFWLVIRQALLMIVDIIERRWDMPRTAEARRRVREDAHQAEWTK